MATGAAFAPTPAFNAFYGNVLDSGSINDRLGDPRVSKFETQVPGIRMGCHE